MRARLRLVTYAVLWVVTLLAVPIALPPAREPTYGPPPLTSTYNWSYGGAPTYQGSPQSSLGGLQVHEAPSTPGHGDLVENWSVGTMHGPSVPWPLTGWQLAYSDGWWESVSWRCPDGSSARANLSHPLAGGLTFPLGGSGAESGSTFAHLRGDCVLAANGTVSAEGGYTRLHPAGGSVSCVLYVCNAYRVYAMWVQLVVRSNASSTPLATWTLQGIYDPTISGYRALSESPGPGPVGTYVNGSMNLTVQGPGGAGTAPSPDPVVEYGQSLLLLLALPLVALAVELLSFLRSNRRADADTEEKVMAALRGDEREGVPPSPLFDSSLDESAPRPPG